MQLRNKRPVATAPPAAPPHALLAGKPRSPRRRALLVLLVLLALAVATAVLAIQRYAEATAERHPPALRTSPPLVLLCPKVSPDRVNDGYCDCPGMETNDEPGTSACSPWGKFTCATSGKSIPSSRVHDGVVDCAEDGSDET